MERKIEIKIIKDSKILTRYSSSFSFSNTTTIKFLKELCQKRFSLNLSPAGGRELFLADGLEISEKRVVPQKSSLEYLIYLEEAPTPRKLNRVPSPDERDLAYPLSKLLKKPNSLKQRGIKLWDAEGWWGDQGETPECVGYAWAHWLDDKPLHKNLPHPLISPTTIYLEAKKLDRWKGEAYDGTSIRGGVKYLKNCGKVSSYHWGFDLNSLINAVLYLGPVVIGTSWYSHMFYPNKAGIIKAQGTYSGGHAYLINGIHMTKKQFRIKNSWGRDWGSKGHAWISFSDMARLIRESGEICYPS